MPHSPTVVLTRRRFIAVTAAMTGAALAAGCVSGPEAGDPDPVRELFTAAERDARELAAADASHGDHVSALRRVADARRVHAERLDGFLGDRQSGDQRTEEESTDPPASAPAAVCPPVDEVRRRLRADAKRAAEVAVSSEGARAEVAAAVSAACTAAVEVVLA